MNRVTSASSSSSSTINPWPQVDLDAIVPSDLISRCMPFLTHNSNHMTYATLFKDIEKIDDGKKREEVWAIIRNVLPQGGQVANQPSGLIVLNESGFTPAQKDEIQALINKYREFTITPEMIALVPKPLYDPHKTGGDIAFLEEDIRMVFGRLRGYIREDLPSRRLEAIEAVLKELICCTLSPHNDNRPLNPGTAEISIENLVLFLIKKLKETRSHETAKGAAPILKTLDHLAKTFDKALCSRTDDLVADYKKFKQYVNYFSKSNFIKMHLQRTLRHLFFVLEGDPFLSCFDYWIASSKFTIIDRIVKDLGLDSKFPKKACHLIHISHLLYQRGIISSDLKSKLGLDDTYSKSYFDLNQETLGLSQKEIALIQQTFTPEILTQISDTFIDYFVNQNTLYTLEIDTPLQFESNLELELLMQLICDKLHYQMPQQPKKHFEYLSLCFSPGTWKHLWDHRDDSAKINFPSEAAKKFLLHEYFERREALSTEDFFGDVKNAGKKS